MQQRGQDAAALGVPELPLPRPTATAAGGDGAEHVRGPLGGGHGVGAAGQWVERDRRWQPGQADGVEHVDRPAAGPQGGGDGILTANLQVEASPFPLDIEEDE